MAPQGKKNKRIVLCLDGTWNNPTMTKEREDGRKVFKPTNVLKMARAVRPLAKDGVHQVVYYDTGVGALGKYPGTSNKVIGYSDKLWGGAHGAGFEANVEQAATFLTNNYLKGDKVFLLGFSRGAAQARALADFISWLGGLPIKSDAYYLPRFYRFYLEHRGERPPSAMADDEEKAAVIRLQDANIELLAVWDTVIALGSRVKAAFGWDSSKRDFYVAQSPTACVQHARQAIAIDERRFDFKMEVWQSKNEALSMKQKWFAGVHSNVGGGYANDGLANVTLDWFVDEASELGLDFDNKFLQPYRKYPQDQAHDTRTAWMKIEDTVGIGFRRRVRNLTGHPASAELEVDKSVFTRLFADPGSHNHLELYRPNNLLEFLEGLGNQLPAYLDRVGYKVDPNKIPPDLEGIFNH